MADITKLEKVIVDKGKIDLLNFHAIIDDPLILICTTSKRCDECRYLKACSAVAEVYKNAKKNN